ncbi:MAG: hypothetical protein ABR573_11545, partial [Candidatus Dormibacteria bacterium]
TQAGLEPNLAANEQLRQRLARLGGVARDASAEAAILAVYTALGRGNSRLRAATLEDAMAVTERTNIPGTTTEWPNWQLALPGGLEALRRSAHARRVALAVAGTT